MQFEWDEAKSEACFLARGFDFAYAAQAFFDPDRLGTKWGQTPINLSALHNQIGVTGPKFGKDGAFRSITAVACNGPCTLQCYM